MKSKKQQIVELLKGILSIIDSDHPEKEKQATVIMALQTLGVKASYLYNVDKKKLKAIWDKMDKEEE